MAFMARITAGMTHELRNVLAVIGESAGLMEDVLAMTGTDPSQSRERFGRITSQILQHVERGIRLTAGLNYFAHTPEKRAAMLDVNKLLEQFVVVTTWFGREKKVSIAARQNNGFPIVESDALKVQMLIFRTLEAVVSLAPAVRSIELSASTSEGGVSISMKLGGQSDDLSGWGSAIREGATWSRVEESAAAVGARVQIDGAGQRVELAFWPVRQNGTK